MNKNCIIVICDEVSIRMLKSYKNRYTNNTVIQINKVLSFHFGSVYIVLNGWMDRRTDDDTQTKSFNYVRDNKVIVISNEEIALIA